MIKINKKGAIGVKPDFSFGIWRNWKMTTKKEIINKLEKERENIKSKGVKKIGLFGSYLKGKQKRGSDIDFLIQIDEDKIAESYFEILFYLEKLFRKKIDLIIEDDLRKELNYVKKEAEYVKIWYLS